MNWDEAIKYVSHGTNQANLAKGERYGIKFLLAKNFNAIFYIGKYSSLAPINKNGFIKTKTIY